MKVVENILELVGRRQWCGCAGWNRQVALRVALRFGEAGVFESGGSVKDRAALGIVLDAERRGVLQPGGTIVEATAGNTGVGLALIGVNRGYKVMLYVPEQFAEEKCKLMRGLGATVERTPED